MGWNDHDDRLMVIADILEGAGMPYEMAYEKALEIREDALMQIAIDEIEEMESA
jgi:hypothetical protein